MLLYARHVITCKNFRVAIIPEFGEIYSSTVSGSIWIQKNAIRYFPKTNSHSPNATPLLLRATLCLKKPAPLRQVG